MTTASGRRRTGTLTLRDYQAETVDKLMAKLAIPHPNGHHWRLAVVHPTGSGKTVTFSALGDAWLASQNGHRRGPVMILAHRDELIDQAMRKYRNVVPDATIGVIKAARHEVHGTKVIVASVQSLNAKRRERTPQPSLLIIDETHHASAKTYRAIIDWADCPVVGVTATLSRSDGKALGRAAGGIFDEITDQRSILWMIRHGYLCDVKGKRIVVDDLDLKGMRKVRGDYSDGELGERLLKSAAPETVAAAIRREAPDDPGVIFAPTVASAQAFATAMRAEGFTCEAVWGAMPLDKDTPTQKSRRTILREYNLGKIDWLANCMVLTEGFDAPRARVAVIARATQSEGLYVQMAGRVLRPFPGKAYALLLDIVGVTTQHELCTLSALAGDAPKDPKGRTLLDLYGTPCDGCGIPADECLWNDEPPVTCCESCSHAPVVVPDDEDEPIPVESLRSVEADLFAGSRQQWLQTEAGYWFLPAGERLIALAPTPDGAYDVVWVRAVPARGMENGGYVVRAVPDYSYAMAAGESAITEAEEVLARKVGSWRKRRASNYPKMINWCKQHKVYVEGMETWRAGAVGDVISKVKATGRLDPMINKRLGV